MRLFIAIELPHEVQSRLAGLRTEINGARWVAAEQLHLTLSFLGEVDDAMIDMLTGVLAEIRAPEFDLRLNSAGCFPNCRKPRVLWVGFEPEPLLKNLAELVRRAVLLCNIPQEERPFSAHITLARFRQPVTERNVGAFLDEFQKQEPMTIRVQKFVLFQSRLIPQGAIHTAIKKFFLTSPKIKNRLRH